MRWHRTTGRSAGTRFADAAGARLTELSRQWRPIPRSDGLPGAPTASGSDAESISAWEALREPSASEPPRRPTAKGHLAPWSASALRGLAVLVAVALAFAGWWLWSGRPRAVAVAPTVQSVAQPLARPAPSAAPAATGPVVVHVTGLVRHPGLVRLPAGARVADAVAAAGGVTRSRAADSVNLARVLLDGEQVVVSLAPPPTPLVPASGSPATVDLNHATSADLEALPGVGPVIAERIVAWRTANGSFRSVDELSEVAGIGDSVLEQVRPLVRV